MRVVLVAAVTADGFIARHENHLADWTSREDKRHFVAITKELGTIVMGSTTFATIGRGLPGRRLVVMTSHPEQYADSEGVEGFSGSPTQLLAKLEHDGVMSLGVVGGAQVYGQFLAARLVDELMLTVEPVMFGNGIALADREVDLRLRLKQMERLGDQAALLHYEVER